MPKPIEVEYSLRFKNLRRIDPSNVEATHRFDFDADYELKVGLPGQRAKDADYPFEFIILQPVARLVVPGTNTGEDITMRATALMRNEAQ